MDTDSLFKLYKEMYFHEMEVKEKIVARTQISYAIVLTGFTCISYMLRMLDFNSNKIQIIFFIFFVSISLIFLIISSWFLSRSLSWESYHGVPSAKETELYRSQLMKYVEDIKIYNADNPTHQQEVCDVDEVIKSFLYERFNICSSHNTEVNAGRSGYANDGFEWILYTLFPLFFACSIFIVGDLDTASPRKELLIKDTNLATQLSQLNEQVNRLNEKSLNYTGIVETTNN